MITSLSSHSPDNHHSAEWPEPPNDFGKQKPLFAPRAQLRLITVMVDAELLDYGDPRQISPSLLLSGMVAHPLVRCFRFADDGPPADLVRKPARTLPNGYVDGWVELTPCSSDGFIIRNVQNGHGSRVSGSAIVGETLNLVKLDTSVRSYANLDAESAYAKRYNDALAAQAAKSIGADLYITDRAYLYESKFKYSGGALCCRPADAIALLGLYLRTQNVFEIQRSPDGAGSHVTDEGLFYWVGARELLPEAWRWFSACVQESSASNDDSLVYLGGSLITRVQRALRARDDVFRALNLPQNNNTAEDALSALDVVMLNLMGAVDACARVAHIALGFPIEKIRNAAWQRDWIKGVRNADEALADTVAEGTDHANTLTVLATLRNSIHGEALQPLGIMENPRKRTDTLIGLPRADVSRLMNAIEALGGRDMWGVHEKIPGRLHVEPGTLLNQLFERSIDLLNALMLKTPVEKLQHVALKTENTVPPTDDAFSERTRLSIRWQLGF